MTWFKEKTIVVPVDYSDESIQAIRFAHLLASDAGAIRAVHVIPDLNTPYGGYIEGLVDDKLIQRAKENLESWLKKNAGETVSMDVRVGDPGHTIVNSATRHESDVIVISSHGRTGISRVLLGSVAERVVRFSHCPVVVLKSASRETSNAKEFNPSSVIVPFDFSDAAINAVKVASQTISDQGCLHVLYVLPVLSAADPSVVWDVIDVEQQTISARAAMEEKLASLMTANTKLDVRVGDPGHVTVSLAEEIGADLIVISSHGRNFLARVLLGSVAERVVRHAHCPVLVLKPKPKSEPHAVTADSASRQPSNSQVDDLAEVFSTDDANYAELLRNALRSEGIKCEIDGEQQGGFTGLTSMSIKLLVRADDYDRARKFIETHDPK